MKFNYNEVESRVMHPSFKTEGVGTIFKTESPNYLTTDQSDNAFIVFDGEGLPTTQTDKASAVDTLYTNRLLDNCLIIFVMTFEATRLGFKAIGFVQQTNDGEQSAQIWDKVYLNQRVSQCRTDIWLKAQRNWLNEPSY